MAWDPVCGMKVDPKGSNHVVEYKGKVYYFCSASCQESFERRNATKYTEVNSKREGQGRSLMSYIHLAIMIFVLLLLILSG